MVCTKCGRPHAGYRCPYCGDFVLNEETAGKVYSRDMKRYARVNGLMTFGVIMVFVVLIGAMIVGVFFQDGYADKWKDKKEAQQKEKEKEEALIDAGFEGETIYSDDNVTFKLTATSVMTDNDWNLKFDVTNNHSLPAIIDVPLVSIGDVSISCELRDGNSFDPYQPGETRSGTVSIDKEAMDQLGISDINQITLWYDMYVHETTVNLDHLEPTSFSFQCKYTNVCENTVDRSGYRLIFENEDARLSVAPEHQYDEENQCYYNIYYIENKRENLVAMKLDNLMVDGTEVEPDGRFVDVPVAPGTGRFWRHGFQDATMFEKDFKFDFRIENFANKAQEYTIEGLSLN